MATEQELLHVFADVNVYIDAVIPWNASNNGLPAVLVSDAPTPISLQGPPAGLVLLAVAQRIRVMGRRVVLHTSEEVLMTVSAKLQDDYQWLPEVVDDVLTWIYDVVERSGGVVVERGSTIPNHQPNDREDNRVLGEALDTPAQLVVTSDAAFIAAGPFGGVAIMHPRDFIRRGGLRSVP